jgi:hypothetical protein
VLQKKISDAGALFRRVAFPEIWELEPVPIFALRPLGENWFVRRGVRFEFLEAVLVQVHVRPRVVAERIARRAPGLQDGRGSSLAGWRFCPPQAEGAFGSCQ